MSAGEGGAARGRRLPAAAALALPAVLALAAAGYVFSGMYNIAADEAHWQVTESLLAQVRTRSINARAATTGAMPDLADSRRVAAGARQYAEMCVQCHLAPGSEDSALREGLYPRPPDFTQERPEPRAAFWVIKHGIKMTGMPAWGASHDDATIWSLVAFMQRLPDLDARAYARLAGTGRDAHEESNRRLK